MSELLDLIKEGGYVISVLKKSYPENLSIPDEWYNENMTKCRIEINFSSDSHLYKYLDLNSVL